METTPLSKDELIRRITDFLEEIGLQVSFRPLGDETFLPGLLIQPGSVIAVDRERLKWPGDILHEAGHLAVKAPADRELTGANPGTDGGEEMAAIAWSYAAARFLDIPAEVVLHEGGYKGGADSLIPALADGGFGVPLLRYYGMLEGKWPHLTFWLRPE